MDGEEDSGDDMPIESTYNDASSDDGGNVHASQFVQQQTGEASQKSSRSVSPVQAVMNSTVVGVPGFMFSNHAVPSNSHLLEPGETAQPCRENQLSKQQEAPLQSEASSDSGDDSDHQKILSTSQLMSQSLISSMVRKEAVSEAHSTTQQELKDQEENQKRERERGVDDSDDTGEATVDAQTVKKRPAKAPVGSYKKSKELPEMGEDRDLLSDTMQPTFSHKTFVVFGGRKTGGKNNDSKTHKCLFNLDYLIELDEDAELLKFELSARSIYKAMKNADPDSDSSKWCADGMIKPFPLSCELLLNGIDEAKTPSFIESLKKDTNALNHVRAATVEIKRSNNRFSTLLRVSPIPPEAVNRTENSGSGDNDTEMSKADILYIGLQKLKAENPDMEFLINIPKKTVATLLGLSCPDPFFTQKLLFHYKNEPRIIKKVLGDDKCSYNHANFDTPDVISKAGSNTNFVHSISLLPESSKKKRKSDAPKVGDVVSKKKTKKSTSGAGAGASSASVEAAQSAPSPSPEQENPVKPIVKKSPPKKIATQAAAAAVTQPPPAPPPASPAALPAQAEQTTQLAFWDAEQQGAATMMDFGIVPFQPPPGGGYRAAIMFSPEVKFWTMENGRLIVALAEEN